MLSVVGLADDKLSDICAEVKKKKGGDNVVCQLANYLFPQGRVVSGHKVKLLPGVAADSPELSMWHRTD